MFSNVKNKICSVPFLLYFSSNFDKNMNHLIFCVYVFDKTNLSKHEKRFNNK